MDYFEYLNKQNEVRQKQEQGSIPINNGEAPDDISGMNVFDESISVTQNADGSTIFSFATEKQLNELDYEKIVSKEELPNSDEKESSLNYILKDILSFEQVKEEADTNDDGDVSADEAKAYFLGLAAKNGDSTTFTSDDFDIFLKEKSIDLEEVLKKQTQENQEVTADETSGEATPETPENKEETPSAPEQPTTTSQSTPAEQSTSNTPTQNDQIPVQSSSAPMSTSGNFGNMAAARNVGSYSQKGTPVKTINTMSLEELKVEKEKRQKTLTEKQKAVGAVHNGSNEKVKTAQKKADVAQKDMEKAIKNDENVSKTERKLYEDTLSELKETEENLSKNAEKTNENKIATEETKTTISSLEQNCSALNEGISSVQGELSKLRSELSALGNSKDESVKKKKDGLNNRIDRKNKELSKKNKELKTKQKELNEAKKSLEKLGEEKTKLEEEKTSLEEDKKTYEEHKAKLEEKIKESCSEETKAKINAYNDAKKNVDTVKASELSAANEAQTKALNAVKEVETKIAEVESRRMKSISSNLDINNIPASVRAQLGGKVMTLPDGTEILGFNYTKIDQMKPAMIEGMKEMQRIANKMGITFVVSDGSRTYAESNAARKRKGNFVAAGGQSPHNYGVAIDIALYKDGKMVGGSAYNEFAQRVKAETGLDWGGDWGSYGKKYETQHFQLANWKQYKTQENLITRHIS